MRFFLPLIILAVLIASCNDEDVADNCLPQALVMSNVGDSVAYHYNDQQKLIGIYRYRTGYVFRKTEITYDFGKILTVVESSNYANTEFRTDRTYHFDYGTDGLPSKLSGYDIDEGGTRWYTEFTHDSNKRLVKAVQTVLLNGWAETILDGGYIYEYNDKGNVSTITYIIKANSDGDRKEVLARENLTFDNSSLLHAWSAELTMLDVYLYNEVPNANNVLSSKIYRPAYYSENSVPTSLTFTLTYDKHGKVTGNHYSGSIPEFGDLIFSEAVYQCH